MNYYSHNIGDYAQATMHLSLVEDAIYSRLLRRYYSEEQPIIDDIQQVCRWVGARTQEEREAVPVILSEFFKLVDGYWHNKRADEEIAAYQSKSAKAADSAAKRWSGNAKAKNQECERNANAMPTHSEGNANQEPITNNQETEEKNTPPTPRKRGSGFDASTIDLPDWLDREDWQSWVSDRKARKKPVTEEGARRQLQQLAQYRAEGHRPADVIANSIAGGYQGLFPPRTQTRAGPPSRSQMMADWNAELGEVLAEGRRATVIDMGTIDATH